jgi:hypothetical protein
VTAERHRPPPRRKSPAAYARWSGKNWRCHTADAAGDRLRDHQTQEDRKSETALPRTAPCLRGDDYDDRMTTTTVAEKLLRHDLISEFQA